MMQRKMQRHHRVAAVSIGERLHIVARLSIDRIIPSVAVAGCFRVFRRLRMVQRKM